MTAVTNVVNAVVGSDNPTDVSAALQDPKVENEMRARLANVVAALNRQEATERTLRRFRGWKTAISI